MTCDFTTCISDIRGRAGIRQATLENTCLMIDNVMKFENQDAFKMTAAYLQRKENLSAATAYFKIL